MTNVHTELTIDSGYDIDTLRVCTDGIGLERPVGDAEGILVRTRLSRSTARQVERREALRLQKKARGIERRKRNAKRRKKAATAKKQKAQRWEKSPLGCLIHGKGYKAYDPALWAKYVEPIWRLYNPKDLKVKRHSGYGVAGKPYTVYTIDIVHKKLGTLYSGSSQLIWDLSSSSELDGVQRA